MSVVKPDDRVYVLRFKNELEEFADQLYMCGFAPRTRFFRKQPRAEIRTVFGFGSLIASVKVHGEMGTPHMAVIASPKPIPIPARRFLRGKLPALRVRFNAQS